MNADQLIKHFHRISEAPDAIPRLRQFILDLAVRGKLTGQDQNEGPAAELLKEIEAQKDRLIEKGLLRKQETSPISEKDQPFELPPNWQWARLAFISNKIHYGFTASASPAIKDVRLLRITDIQNNSVDWESVPGCEIDPSDIDQYRLQRGDILIARTGGTIGKTFLVSEVPVTAVFASYLIRVQPSAALYDRYLKFFLESTAYWTQLQDGSRGTGQPNVNGQTLGRILVAIPPLGEQQRIVTKVDGLMALCDKLESAKADRESRRNTLVAASLHHLNNRGDAEEFRRQAGFYLNHLPDLTASAEHIQRLRQSVRSLAVRGKLAPQVQDDEPASKLLQRIGAEMSVNVPFPIPPSWAWVSLSQIGVSRLGKMLDKAKNKGTARRYLRNVNVRWFDFDLSDVFEMRFEDTELDEFVLRIGDVLICEGGEPGRAAVWDERESNIYFQKAIHRVRFGEGVDPHFFVNVLRESADSGRLSAYFTGVGIKHFTGKGLSSYVFPIPPIDEQRRIVARIDHSMDLCDQLEAQITHAQAGSQRFLDAVLHSALETNNLHEPPILEVAI